MADNQNNPLPPVVTANLVDQNPAPRTMYDYAKPTLTGTESTVGGTLINKTPGEAYKFIEEMSLNNYQWQVMRTKLTKTAGVFNLDAVTMLSNQVELLNKKIDGLYGSTQVHPMIRCDSNGGGVHNTDYSSVNPGTDEEQIHYMGNNSRPQNNPYSNAGWRNHPNFS
ncbi:hypothetical protein PVK06_027115 [Gossypium arboreum]|uniref:Retrotransposon gag protein n=1 Tax=Gossypium arboreum TaxID=29729 RepID=A0ABR0P2C3_GOSAR|nr:hypothetical protein PVK06_027115 [Gossypium arboreum]